MDRFSAEKEVRWMADNKMNQYQQRFCRYQKTGLTSFMPKIPAERSALFRGQRVKRVHHL